MFVFFLFFFFFNDTATTEIYTLSLHDALPISLLLPLSLWALERGRRGNPLWLLLSAGAIASIPLSGQVHLAIGAVPFYAAYALVRLPAVTRRLALYLGSAALGVALSVGAG